MRKALILLILLLWSTGSTVAGSASDPPESITRTLALLRDGRFDEAEVALSTTPRSENGGEVVRMAFFRGFVTYWRSVFDDKNPELLGRLERDLDRAVQIGEAQFEQSPEDPAVLTWFGSARVLRAHLYADQDRYFKAGYEAKHAKRLLERAANSDAHRADAYFGLGTFNYYASQVPALVKGIRFLIGLPGGDREGGLEQLGEAAESSSYFADESRILLATIYAGRRERSYDLAQQQLDRLVRDNPTVTSLDVAGLLDLVMSRPRDAALRLDAALARASGFDGLDPSVQVRLTFNRARTEMALFRPDLALERLRPLIDGKLAVPITMQSKVGDIARQAALWTPAPAFYLETLDDSARAELAGLAQQRLELRDAVRLSLPALRLERAGELEQAAAIQIDLAQAHPSPELACLAGRGLLIEGQRPAAALDWLTRAGTSKELTPDWQGSCLLMAGLAADLAGDHDVAARYYRRATDSPPFNGRGSARHYLDHPYTAGHSVQLSALGLKAMGVASVEPTELGASH